MSNENSNLKSYAPVVGRIKSKRWVQTSHPNYDGDDWGDDYGGDYYSEEENPLPPMPSLPAEYATTGVSSNEGTSSTTTSIPDTLTPSTALPELVLGTSGQKLQQQAAAAAEKFVEKGVTKYSLHDGTDEPIVPSSSSSLSSQPTVVPNIHPPIPSSQLDTPTAPTATSTSPPVVTKRANSVQRKPVGVTVPAVLSVPMPSAPKESEILEVEKDILEMPKTPESEHAPDSPIPNPDNSRFSFIPNAESMNTVQNVIDTPESDSTAQPIEPPHVLQAISEENDNVEPGAGYDADDIYEYYSAETNHQPSHDPADDHEESDIPKASPTESSGSSRALSISTTTLITATHHQEVLSEPLPSSEPNEEPDAKSIEEHSSIPLEHPSGLYPSSFPQYEDNLQNHPQSPLPLPTHRFADSQDSRGETADSGRPSISMDSMRSYSGETDSSASLSTGRRSPDSYFHSNRESIEQRNFRLSGESHTFKPKFSGSGGLAGASPLYESDWTPNQRDEDEDEASAAAVAALKVGRWKPILNDDESDPVVDSPVQASLDTSLDTKIIRPTTEEESPLQQTPSDENQKQLEREILGTFGPEQEPLVSDDHEDLPPDPELAALYQHTSSFLSRPISQYDYSKSDNNRYHDEIRPLSTIKSNDSKDTASELSLDIPESEPASPTKAELNVHQQRFENAEDTHSSSSSSSSDSDSVRRLSAEQREMLYNPDENVVPVVSVERGEEPLQLEPVQSSDTGITSSVDGSEEGSENAQDVPDSPNKFKSMIIPDSPVLSSSASPQMSIISDNNNLSPSVTRGSSSSSAKLGALTSYGTAGGGRKMSLPQTNVAKLNRPPAYDFTGILAKAHSSDRKLAFDEARRRECDYNPGLQSWLIRAYHANQDNIGVYISGRPPIPDQATAKLAGPTRSMSTTLMRPAKHVLSGRVGEKSTQMIGKVGERSTKTAKGLFARGRKFIKSQPNA